MEGLGSPNSLSPATALRPLCLASGSSFRRVFKCGEFWKLLGGSWVVINGVISPLIGVIVIVMLLITPLIVTHEPPSSTLEFKVWGFGSRE